MVSVEALVELLVNLAPSFFAPFFGALLGIPFGFVLHVWLDRRRTHNARVELLESIKESLGKNISLMKQMGREVTPSNIIYYNLDLALWSHISEKLDILSSQDLEKEILRIYYELTHLARKVDIQLEHPFLSGQPRYSNVDIWTDLVNNGIVGHIKVLLPQVEMLSSRVKQELGDC